MRRTRLRKTRPSTRPAAEKGLQASGRLKISDGGFAHRSLSSSRYYQFTRPEQPPFLSRCPPSWRGPLARRESGFQRVRAPSRILCLVHSRTFVAVLTLHRITCHAVRALHRSIIGLPRTTLAPVFRSRRTWLQ